MRGEAHTVRGLQSLESTQDPGGRTHSCRPSPQRSRHSKPVAQSSIEAQGPNRPQTATVPSTDDSHTGAASSAHCVLVARNRIGRGGHERWHAFLGAVGRIVCVAAGNAEHQAVEVVGTRAGDTSAEPLVGASEEAGESMRTVRTRLARNAAVDAGAVLASKARNAIVGVVTARLDAQTTLDAQVARVGRVAAVLVVLAAATTGDETTRASPRSPSKDRLRPPRTAGPRRIVRPGLGTPGKARWSCTMGHRLRLRSHQARRCPSVLRCRRPPPARAVTAIDARVRIDAGTALRTGRKRGGSRFTTAGHSCSGQQNVSKETHCRSGKPASRGSRAVLWREDSASASRSHPGDREDLTTVATAPRLKACRHSIAP